MGIISGGSGFDERECIINHQEQGWKELSDMGIVHPFLVIMLQQGIKVVGDQDVFFVFSTGVRFHGDARWRKGSIPRDDFIIRGNAVIPRRSRNIYDEDVGFRENIVGVWVGAILADSLVTFIDNDEHHPPFIGLRVDMVDGIAKGMEVCVGLALAKHATAHYFAFELFVDGIESTPKGMKGVAACRFVMRRAALELGVGNENTEFLNHSYGFCKVVCSDHIAFRVVVASIESHYCGHGAGNLCPPSTRESAVELRLCRMHLVGSLVG
jgi:hypothetical protein